LDPAPVTDRPRNLLILTPRAATIGALLRQRIRTGGELLRALLPAERDEPAETVDEPY
jgi:hypothetical protein